MGLLQATGKSKELDTLAAVLITGGMLLVLVGGDVISWTAARLQSVKTPGFALTLRDPAAVPLAEDGEDSGAVSVAGLVEEVERRLRSAACWTAMPDVSSLSRGQLLMQLTRQGYMSPADAAVLESLFDSGHVRASRSTLQAAQAVSERLRIGILLRAAEMDFERAGRVPQRPGAPRLTVGYHFTVGVRDGVRVYVAVVIAKKESELAPRRAKLLEKVPGASHRWLVPQQPINATAFGDVRVIPLEDLPRAVSDLLAEREPG